MSKLYIAQLVDIIKGSDLPHQTLKRMIEDAHNGKPHGIVDNDNLHLFRWYRNHVSNDPEALLKEAEEVQPPKKETYFEFDSLSYGGSDNPIPAVGTMLMVKMNGIGKATVLKYFVEHGYIGMIVQPVEPPEWYVKQNGADEPCHVFPAECGMTVLEEVTA